MLRLTLCGGFSLTDEAGAEVVLKSRKAKGLLAYLATPPGRVRSREEIMALLWSDRSEAQARGSLRQVLSGVRKVMGDGVFRVQDDTIALNTDVVAVAAPTDAPFLAGFRLNDPAFEDWLRDETLRHEDGAPLVPPPSPDALTEHPTVAVLPFENMAEGSEQDFFADGITQDIITELSRFTGLFVIAPRSTRQFRDSSLSAWEIGKELEAEYIVEGSVRRAGSRVRITARLIDVEDDTQLWADRYDRELEDVFAIQEEVAQEIAMAVPVQIEAEAYDRVLERPTQDLSAYEYVLRGEYARHLDAGAAEAAAFFERAIKIDADCARAYANLADWHAYEHYLEQDNWDVARSKVRDLCDKALEIEPGDPAILATVAGAYLSVGDFDLARRCIDRAIRINPNHYAVMGMAALVLSRHGDTADAVEWLECYQRNDPLPRIGSDEIAFEVFFNAERYDEAIAVMTRWAGRSPDVAADLAAAYAQAGRMEEAAEMRARFEATAPEGEDITAHIAAMRRTGTRPRESALWLDGYRKAGFDV